MKLAENNNTVVLVGIAGAFGSGKDAAADVLVSKYGFVKTSMARALKIEVYDRLLRPTADFVRLDGYEESLPRPSDDGATPGEKLDWINAHKPVLRRLLQVYGTEYRRAQDQDYWVKRAAEFVDNSDRPVVIPDIRFPNEAEMIRARGGRLWLIRRESVETADDRNRTHASESFYRTADKWDHVIFNTAGLDWLGQRVSSAFIMSGSGAAA